MRFSSQRSRFDLDVDLVLGDRERIGIIGPNGAGKSTLLDQLLSHQRHEGAGLTVRLTQHALCFPHLNVLENISYAPLAQGRPAAEAEATARDLLARAGLSDRVTDFPATLSAGQQQQVALLRALAANASTLLLDEPMSFLDVQAAKEYRRLLVSLSADISRLIVVTHDPLDLQQLVDRVLVLEGGRLVADMPRSEFFTAPPNDFATALLIQLDNQLRASP